MIIEELKLALFKGFRDFAVACCPFTCLVGRNSHGKTSVLQAIRLLHDILVFAFGGGERPTFSNPQWQADPSHGLRRVSFGDPDAIWLHKQTAEPCKISAKYSGAVELCLEITGRNRYVLDILIDGSSVTGAMGDSSNREVVQELFSLQPVYVPPVGAVSPTENLLWEPQMAQHTDQGRDSQCWRSRLYWLWNDGDKRSFDDLVELVQQYLPEARVLPPSLTHDHPGKVLIEFEEEDTTFDISSSGGGLRTLLNLAAVLHFSRSQCLLCDEPDSHLHGSLQRAVARMLLDFSVEEDRQVIVATHAPDFIAEIPVESITWIDRTQTQGRRCNDIGRVLADLGTVSKADAVRACGADKVLFIEGSLDRATLRRLITLAGGQNPFDDQSVLIGKLPSGKGDAIHLRTFHGILRGVFKLDVAMASLTDNDYELVAADGNADASNDFPLLLSLGCKEVENYLLGSAVLAKAAAIAAERRRDRMGKAISAPDSEAFSAKLKEILGETTIRDTVRLQLIPRYMASIAPGADPSTRLAEAEDLFQQKWNDDQWRIRNCPGKAVLKRVRQWCQDEYGLTLTTNALANALTECPPDVLEITKRIQMFFYGNSCGA